ncbi:MAG: hypothetical protein JSV17_16180 [Candidatus Aminicenantes bacterium]|nr:MAG: hypothetical protein JSV17_16180 [Candidatus Aminicenantes bacterium]
MIARQYLKQKGFLTTIIVGLILCWALPSSAADRKQENQPTPVKVGGIDFEPMVFSLALKKSKEIQSVPLLTLLGDYHLNQNQNFPSLRKKVQISQKVHDGTQKKSSRLENSLFTASLLTLTALNIADYVSTVKALQLTGLEEGNPILRPFTKNMLLFGAVKLGISAFDFYVLKSIHKKNKTLAWVLSIAGNFAMSYIVSNNIRKIQSVMRK